MPFFRKNKLEPNTTHLQNIPLGTLSSREYQWMYDSYYSKSVWLNRALFGLLLVIGLLAMSIVAQITLLPLKEKVPYLYAFDQATGEINKIGALESTTLPANWMLTRYFITQYVIHYESYDFQNINYPYQLVYAQSAYPVRKQYEELMNSDHPQSPYQKFGKDKYLTVRVTSINRLNDNTVDVKFEKTLHDRSAHTETTISKEAIVKWEYERIDVSEKLLERDPLGFKVTYYQVSQVNLEHTS